MFLHFACVFVRVRSFVCLFLRPFVGSFVCPFVCFERLVQGQGWWGSPWRMEFHFVRCLAAKDFAKLPSRRAEMEHDGVQRRPEMAPRCAQKCDHRPQINKTNIAKSFLEAAKLGQEAGRLPPPRTNVTNVQKIEHWLPMQK